MKFKKSITALLISLVAMLAAAVGVYFLADEVFSFAFRLIGLFLPFIIAYFLSVALSPLVNKLERKLKIPRNIATILIILLVVGILGSIISSIIWKIIGEARDVYRQLPQIIAEVKDTWAVVSIKLSNLVNGMPESVQSMVGNFGESTGAALGELMKNSYSPAISGIGSFAKSLPGVFVWIIVFMLSLYFMIADAAKLRSLARGIFSKKFRERFSEVKQEIKRYLGGYIKAQLIIMSIAAIIIFLGLSILNVQFALLIALAIAIFDALPFFGSGAVLWPWSLISFLNGNLKAGFGLIIIYIAVIFTRQMIEPKIVSENIGVNPIFTLLSMYLGYKIFSIGGMILGPMLLILTVSLYKASVFDGIIRFFKLYFGKIKKEFSEIIMYFKQM